MHRLRNLVPLRKMSTEGVWKKRSVVSSFILKYDESRHPLIALFKRSDKVSTYRHHLAAISGSIDPSDPSPLSAAWRELREETTLASPALSLHRRGKPFTFRDDDLRREWTVYPFLFRLNSPAADEQRICIDWEHESWGWHDPDEAIRNLESRALNGVPRLTDSLRRVWFEYDLGPVAGKILAEGLEKLANDYESGARQLADAALLTLKGVLQALEESDDVWSKLRMAAWHLCKNGRESMSAAITSVLLTGLAAVESALKESRQAALKALDAQLEARKESAAKVATAFAGFLERTFPEKKVSILTLSESSTIRTGLLKAAQSGLTLDLRILESRPLFEGVSLAGSLSQELKTGDHSITLYTDASAALAARGADVVVIGADRIASSGAVSNKTGTLPTLLSAKHISPGVKTVMLGESDKVAPGKPEEHVVENNDPEQLRRAWRHEYNSARVCSGANLDFRIHNVFFEWAPADLVDVYITERGEWTVHDIAQHADRLLEEETRFFGDL